MSNKGKGLERVISQANLFYANNDLALIQRVSDPVTLTKTGSFFRSKSTVDFLGVIKGGYPVAIEAKEYSTKTGTFPCANIKDHQLEYLKKFNELGGIAILAIKWKEEDFIYIIDYSDYQTYIDEKSRKSIPLDDLKEISRIHPIDDYLKLKR